MQQGSESSGNGTHPIRAYPPIDPQDIVVSDNSTPRQRELISILTKRCNQFSPSARYYRGEDKVRCIPEDGADFTNPKQVSEYLVLYYLPGGVGRVRAFDIHGVRKAFDKEYLDFRLRLQGIYVQDILALLKEVYGDDIFTKSWDAWINSLAKEYQLRVDLNW